MNKILVTGAGVGSDLGLCVDCSLNFNWMTARPNTFIWADKIYITKNAWERRKQISYENDDLQGKRYVKAIGMVLDIAKEYNLIEMIDVSGMYQETVPSKIYSDVLNDSKMLLEQFSGMVKNGDEGVPNQLIIDGKDYCGPYIASIYASLKIAQDLDANCLFSERDYNYLKYKYGLRSEMLTRKDKLEALNEIFTLYLPNDVLLSKYRFNNKCGSCAKKDDCFDKFLFEVEQNTINLLKWRDYDEIIQAKEVIDKIVGLKMYNDLINTEDVKKEFLDLQKKINRNIKKIFPAVKRWTHLTTILAMPLTIYNAAACNTTATITSTSILGLAKTAEEYMNFYENKNRWVGFINDTKKNRI